MFIQRSKEYPPVGPLLVSGVTVDVERPVRPKSLTTYPMGEVPMAYEASTSTSTDHPPSSRFTRANPGRPELAASS